MKELAGGVQERWVMGTELSLEVREYSELETEVVFDPTESALNVTEWYMFMWLL